MLRAVEAMTWTIAILFLLIGLVAGWLLRRGRRQPGLLILEEMFAQKVRQAEKERDQSVRELSANRVEMRTFADRFAALDRRIAAADAELEDSRKARALAEAGMERLETDLDALRVDLGESRRREHQALAECALAFEERGREARARSTAEEELRALRAESAESARRLEGVGGERSALASTLDERSRELDGSRNEGARLLRERDEARSRIARLEQELSALPGVQHDLGDVRAELGDARAALEQHARSLKLREEELAAARARIGELEVLPGTLSALRTQIGEREEEHGARERELERVWRERSALELAARDAELATERRRGEERLAQLEALGLELERTRARVRELASAGETHTLEALSLIHI